VEHTNRIKGLLFAQGISDYELCSVIGADGWTS
jgi:hypothetical protein